MVAKYKAAALAYIGYGLCYFAGAIHLARIGVLNRGGPVFYIIGLFFLIAVPLLLWNGYRSRWLKMLCGFVFLSMGIRIIEVTRVAFTSESVVPLFFGQNITMRAGATIFAVITAVAFYYVGRALFAKEKTPYT